MSLVVSDDHASLLNDGLNYGGKSFIVPVPTGRHAIFEKALLYLLTLGKPC
jgi:hypothetical protein